MGILAWLILGLMAGFLASLVMRGGGYGMIGDIIVGIIGAYLGRWLFTHVFHTRIGVNFWVDAILTATVGAIVLLLIIRLIRRA